MSYDLVQTSEPKLSTPSGHKNLRLVTDLSLRLRLELDVPIRMSLPQLTPRQAIELGHAFFGGLPLFLRQEAPLNGSITFADVQMLASGRFRLVTQPWGVRFAGHCMEQVGEQIGLAYRLLAQLSNHWWDSEWGCTSQVDLVFENNKPPDWLVEGCVQRKFKLLNAAHI